MAFLFTKLSGMILLESIVLHDHVLRVLWTALFLYGLSLFLSGMVPSLLGIKSSGPWPHIGARFFSYTHAGKSAGAIPRGRQKWGVNPKKSILQELGFLENAND